MFLISYSASPTDRRADFRLQPSGVTERAGAAARPVARPSRHSRAKVNGTFTPPS